MYTVIMAIIITTTTGARGIITTRVETDSAVRSEFSTEITKALRIKGHKKHTNKHSGVKLVIVLLNCACFFFNFFRYCFRDFIVSHQGDIIPARESSLSRSRPVIVGTCVCL